MSGSAVGVPATVDAGIVSNEPELDMTIVEPSGDQSGESSAPAVDVTWTAAPPLEEIRQMSRGTAEVYRE